MNLFFLRTCSQELDSPGFRNLAWLAQSVQNFLRLFVGLCIFAATHTAIADDSQWEVRKTSDGITVSSREEPGSPINAIRAEAEFDVPLDVVLQLLLDVDNRPEWNSICREAKQVAAESNDSNQRLEYIYYDMPWPVKDRDLVLEFKHEQSEESAKISATVVDGVVDSNDKAVRVSKAWEEWLISRVSDTKAKLTMTVFMDPNGPIPAWLINSMSVSQPLEAMAKLRELAAARYKNTESATN